MSQAIYPAENQQDTISTQKSNLKRQLEKINTHSHSVLAMLKPTRTQLNLGDSHPSFTEPAGF